MLRRTMLSVAALLLALLLGLGSQSVSRPVQAQRLSAGMVFQDQITRYNSGDLEAELATFTDTAVLVGPASCTLSTPCVGTGAIRAGLAASIADHAQATIISLQEAGSTVSGQLELRSDRIRAAGVERAVFTYLVQVQGGYVAASVRVPDLSDAQTATFVASQS